MATSTSAEHSATRIAQLFVRNFGGKEGDILGLNTLSTIWYGEPSWTADDQRAGIESGIEAGWFARTASGIKLTDIGYGQGK
jgi:hypothetical protein